MKKSFEENVKSLVNGIYDIDYDNVDFTVEDIDGESWSYQSWVPATINGLYNPTLADRLLRRNQGKLFSMMKKIGMPLRGWDQFDRFVGEIHAGKNIKGSYQAALEEPVY